MRDILQAVIGISAAVLMVCTVIYVINVHRIEVRPDDSSSIFNQTKRGIKMQELRNRVERQKSQALTGMIVSGMIMIICLIAFYSQWHF